MCGVPKREQDGWVCCRCASKLLCPLQVGNTPLHLAIAAMKNHTAWVERLLTTTGIDVNIGNNVSSYNGY